MKRLMAILSYSKLLFHHFIHLLFGLLATLTIYIIDQPANDSFLSLLLIGLGASLLPDLEHFLFVFLYSLSSEYAKSFKKYLCQGKIGRWANFCRLNHKNNFGVYGHNLFTVLVAFILTWAALRAKNNQWAVFWLAFGFHFVCDILDDPFHLGKLNPNWFCSFQSKPQNLTSF